MPLFRALKSRPLETLLLLPEAPSEGDSLWHAFGERRRLESSSPLPHEQAAAAVQLAVDQWLAAKS